MPDLVEVDYDKIYAGIPGKRVSEGPDEGLVLSNGVVIKPRRWLADGTLTAEIEVGVLSDDGSPIFTGDSIRVFPDASIQPPPTLPTKNWPQADQEAIKKVAERIIAHPYKDERAG